MRDAVRALVEGIDPWDAREERDHEETLVWINRGAELYRQEAPARPPRHLVCYFLLMDGPWLLLVDHIKAGLWLPTGGHCDPGEHPRATVMREVREELSVEAEFLCGAPVFLTLETTRGRKDMVHEDVTFWYVLAGDRGHDYVYDQGEFHGLKWFLPADVPYARAEPNLRRFLGKLAKQA